MAAGDIYYHALSGAGANIGKAIEESILRAQKQKADITRDMAILDRLSQMPDPTDPTGTKTLVDEKKMIALRHLKGSQLQAAAEGEIAAIQLGQQIYKSSAPIRSLMSGPQTTTDESGRQWRWTGREWVPIPKGKEAKEPIDAPTKKLTSTLAPYGLTVDDLSNIDTDSLHFQDESGQEIKPANPENKQTWMQWLKGEQPAPVTQDLGEGAAFVGGTAGDKEFQIPAKKWPQIARAYKNIQAGQSQEPSEIQAAGQPPVVKSAAEARKLAPGTLFQTPDGRYFRVPQSSPNGG